MMSPIAQSVQSACLYSSAGNRADGGPPAALYDILKEKCGHLQGKLTVIFGFSAGGAAGLLSITESGVRPQGVIVLNAPLSISQAVDGYERQLGRRYSWTKAARRAAIRYDVGAHASQIARQHSGTAFLFVQSDHDAGYSSASANSVAVDLKAAASRYTPEPDIGAVVVPDSDHYVLDSSRPKDLKGQAAEATARALISDWVIRHALERAGAGHG
jgi:hypothetical protein